MKNNHLVFERFPAHFGYDGEVWIEAWGISRDRCDREQ
jgi:hypothetical protein